MLIIFQKQRWKWNVHCKFIVERRGKMRFRYLPFAPRSFGYFRVLPLIWRGSLGILSFVRSFIYLFILFFLWERTHAFVCYMLTLLSTSSAMLNSGNHIESLTFNGVTVRIHLVIVFHLDSSRPWSKSKLLGWICVEF